MEGQNGSKEKSDKQDKTSEQTVTIQQKNGSSIEAEGVTTQQVREARNEQDKEILAALSAALETYINDTYTSVETSEVSMDLSRGQGGLIQISVRVNAQKFTTTEYWNSRCITDLTLTWNQKNGKGNVSAALDFQVSYHDEPKIGRVQMNYKLKKEATPFTAEDISQLVKSFVCSIEEAALYFQAQQNDMEKMEQLWLDNMEDNAKQRTECLAEMTRQMKGQSDEVKRQDMNTRLEVFKMMDEQDKERRRRTLSLAKLQSKLDRCLESTEQENVRLELATKIKQYGLVTNSEDRCTALAMLNSKLETTKNTEEQLEVVRQLEVMRVQNQIEDTRDQREWWMETEKVTPKDRTFIVEESEADIVIKEEKKMKEISDRIIEQLKEFSLMEELEKMIISAIEEWIKELKLKQNLTMETIEREMYQLGMTITAQMEPKMNRYTEMIREARVEEVEISMSRVTDRIEDRLSDHIQSVISRMTMFTINNKQMEKENSQKKMEAKKSETERMEIQMLQKKLKDTKSNTERDTILVQIHKLRKMQEGGVYLDMQGMKERNMSETDEMMVKIEEDREMEKNQTLEMRKRIDRLHQMEIKMRQEINEVALRMMQKINQNMRELYQEGVDMPKAEEMAEWIIANIGRTEKEVRCTMEMSGATIKLEMYQIKSQMKQGMEMRMRKQMELLLVEQIRQKVKPGQEEKIKDMVDTCINSELLHMLVSPEYLHNKLTEFEVDPEDRLGAKN